MNAMRHVSLPTPRHMGKKGARFLVFAGGIILSAAFIFTTQFLFAHAVRAESPNFTISPIKSFLSLKPGETSHGSFSVVNRSEDALPLQVIVKFFGVSDEQGSITFLEDQGIASKENPGSWLSLDSASLLLASGETRIMPYSISVPEKAALGTFELAAIFESKFPAPHATNEPNAQLLPGIGSLFFIDVVPNDPNEALDKGVLRVTEFAIPEEQRFHFQKLGASLLDALGLLPGFIRGDEVSFVTKLSNEGRYIARPSGAVHIAGFFGREVGIVPLPEGAVLPGLTRAYTVSFKEPLWFPDAAFLPEALRHNFLPIRHTASLSLSSSTGHELENPISLLTFWVFPDPVALSTIVILTLIVVFVVLYRQRVFKAAHALLAYRRLNR